MAQLEMRMSRFFLGEFLAWSRSLAVLFGDFGRKEESRFFHSLVADGVRHSVAGVEEVEEAADLS